MRHLYLHKYCNEGQICVAFQYAGSKPSRSHRRFNSDMMVQYTFRECLSLTIRLYITQHLKVTAHLFTGSYMPVQLEEITHVEAIKILA